MRTAWWSWFSAFVLLLSVARPGANAAEQQGAPEVFDIPGLNPGVVLHLEHLGPPAGEKKGQAQAVLLLHGNFFPASSTFGVELPGGSALGALGAAGLHAYALDLRGYGGSARPPFVSEPIGPYERDARHRSFGRPRALHTRATRRGPRAGLRGCRRRSKRVRWSSSASGIATRRSRTRATCMRG